MPADLQELEGRLGHVFRNRDLLVRALTHRSFSSERKVPEQHPDNEQLEFFGDAILGFLVSECLVTLLPAAPEGQLSKLKNRLVSADRLYEAAQRLELGAFLNLGRGEEMGGGRLKRSLLADALEAVIAALYLDGSLSAARELVTRYVIGDQASSAPELQNVNYKGELEERVHVVHLPKPHYAIIEEMGPGHAKVFLVEATVGEAYAGRGVGSTKKAAAQQAAKSILDQMDARSKAALKIEA
jgi:ribonuclease III